MSRPELKKIERMYKIKRFSVIEKSFGNKENKAKKKAWELSESKKVKVNPDNIHDQSKGIKYMLLDDNNRHVRLDDNFAKMYEDKVQLAKLREANKSADPLMEKMKLKNSDPDIFEVNRKLDKVKHSLGRKRKEVNEVSERLDKLYDNITEDNNRLKDEVTKLKSEVTTAPKVEQKVTEEIVDSVDKSKDKVSKVGKKLSKNAKIGLGLAAGTAVVGGTAYGIHRYRK